MKKLSLSVIFLGLFLLAGCSANVALNKPREFGGRTADSGFQKEGGNSVADTDITALVPDTDLGTDLGTSALRWGSLYVNGINATYITSTVAFATDEPLDVDNAGNTVTSTLNSDNFAIAKQTDFNFGKFYVDSSGNLTASGTIANAKGTVSAPNFTFLGDTDTGIYSSAANSVEIASNGSQQAQFLSNIAYLKAISNINSDKLDISGKDVNDASAVGVRFGNVTTLNTNGGKIAGFYPDYFSTERSYINIYGTYLQQSGTAQTTNNTTTTIITFTPPYNPGLYDMNFTIFASSSYSGVNDRAIYKLNQFASTTPSGDVALIGATVSLNTQESSSTWKGEIEVSGSTVLCRGLGESGITVDWRCDLTYNLLR